LSLGLLNRYFLRRPGPPDKPESADAPEQTEETTVLMADICTLGVFGSAPFADVIGVRKVVVPFEASGMLVKGFHAPAWAKHDGAQRGRFATGCGRKCSDDDPGRLLQADGSQSGLNPFVFGRRHREHPTG
jgi:hypothetical protein